MMKQKKFTAPPLPPLEWCAWFSGLVDGEGYFTIFRNRVRWVSAEFGIHMRADDRLMLEDIRKQLGMGTVKVYRSRCHKNPMVDYRVYQRQQQLHLVRVLDQFPMRSRKRRDYEVWRTFVILHQDRRNASDPRIEQLLSEIRSAREFKETP